MSDPIVLEELKQDDTVRKFSLSALDNINFLEPAKYEIEYQFGRESLQITSQHKRRADSNCFLHLPRTKLLDAREREKLEKGDQEKQSLRFVSQFNRRKCGESNAVLWCLQTKFAIASR